MATPVQPCQIRYSKCYKQQYPNNLIDKIFGIGYHETHPITDDKLAAIEYIITTALNQQEQDIIRLRYKERKTLNQCAEDRKCTHERIRQVENQAVWKLQMPIHKTAMEMGLKAFYEQDIHEIYQARQTLLTCDIFKYNGNLFGMTKQDLHDLYDNNIKTIGDMLFYNMTDFKSILPAESTRSAIRMRADCLNQLARCNEIIAHLEQYSGKYKTPTVQYPTNLFDAIFGRNLTNHHGPAPSLDQFTGLNWLMEQKLTGYQRAILYYKYECNMSIQECSRQLRTKKNTITDCIRDVIHILREQPGCDSYIYGLYTPAANPKPTTPLLEKTVRYLTDLDISQHDQSVYLKTTKLCTLPMLANHITALHAKGLLTAEDALLCDTNDISDELKNLTHIAICMHATKVNDLHLSTRANNALRRSGIKTADIILSMSDADLLSLDNLGAGSLKNIRIATDEILNKLQAI